MTRGEIRNILRIVLILYTTATSPIFASEGLSSAAIFLCNPITLTEKIVAECVREYPKLERHARKTLTAWRKRNLADGKKLTASCRAHFRESSENKVELLEFEKKRKQLESEWSRDIVKQLTSRGELSCDERLNELDSGKEDLKQFVDLK